MSKPIVDQNNSVAARRGPWHAHRVSTEIDRIETYYDSVPRSDALLEQCGPFTLFVGLGGRRFYARPFLEPESAPAQTDVVRDRSRQRELQQPESFEWIDELHPRLDTVVSATGLTVHHLPLMVLRGSASNRVPAGYTARVLPADDPLLPDVLAAIGVGFSRLGTAVGSEGAAERTAIRDAAMSRDPQAHLATRAAIRAGRTTYATVQDDHGPVAGGNHSPRGTVSEITGLATLPAHRRRGIGAALTGTLTADARLQGVELCFLSAASAEVARVYASAGFERVGTACIAEHSPKTT